MPVASMKRISPPVGVQASPVATPGMPVRSASSRKKRDGPEQLGDLAWARWSSARAGPRRGGGPTLRQIAAISRSRLRRPASRV